MIVSIIKLKILPKKICHNTFISFNFKNVLAALMHTFHILEMRIPFFSEKSNQILSSHAELNINFIALFLENDKISLNCCHMKNSCNIIFNPFLITLLLTDF